MRDVCGSPERFECTQTVADEERCILLLLQFDGLRWTAAAEDATGKVQLRQFVCFSLSIHLRGCVDIAADTAARIVDCLSPVQPFDGLDCSAHYHGKHLPLISPLPPLDTDSIEQLPRRKAEVAMRFRS